MKAEDLYALPLDGNGWRRLPDGDEVKLGDRVTLGDGVTLGNGVKLGDEVTLDAQVTLGNEVTLGNGVMLGNGVTRGNWVTLGNWVMLGNGVTLGDRVTLGDGVKLGEGVKLGNDVEWERSPLQIQGSRHLLYVADSEIVGVGCLRGTAEWWDEHYEAVGRKEKYTEQQVLEYRRWLDIAIAWQAKHAPKTAAKEGT